MNKHLVAYYQCPICDFLQTDTPYWLKETYKTPINVEDTGYIRRNINQSKIVLVMLIFFFDKTKKYLDYGSGYGILPRIMRDYGLDFYWQDKFTENLFCKYFEYSGQHIEAVTCFECFEHFVDPIAEIEKLLSISKNIIFSTLLMPSKPKPPPQTWWYYGFNHGQHISFYSLKTITFLAKKYGLYLSSNKVNFHMLTRRKINPFMFRVLYKIGISRWGLYFSKFLKSRTDSDSLFVLKNEEK